MKCKATTWNSYKDKQFVDLNQLNKPFYPEEIKKGLKTKSSQKLKDWKPNVMTKCSNNVLLSKIAIYLTLSLILITGNMESCTFIQYTNMVLVRSLQIFEESPY